MVAVDGASTVSSASLDYSDTSRWSFHVDDHYYRYLRKVTDAFTEDWVPAEPKLLANAQALLVQEARLLDEGRFNDWLDLFTPDCLYWIPVSPGGGDPTTEVSHAFDDRRRLEDRVYWLRTGLAFCQIPQSRTRRIVGNTEARLDADGESLLVRSNFIVSEFRAGASRILSGWYGHVLLPSKGGYRIRLKQANLVDSEHGHENLTLVF